MPSLPDFSTDTHGFPFANAWEPGTPVVSVPTPFGPVTVGDASGGVCGGMVFAAADFYLFGVPVPRDRSPELVRYFCRRLLDSWALPFGVARYFDWQRRPGATRRWRGLTTHRGVTRLTVEDELPRIRAAIDAGLPAPLGLVKVESWRPADLARNHQVLCHGYDDSDGAVTLHCYDPNWPGSSVALTVRTDEPDADVRVEHGAEGPSVRGVFLTDYARPASLDVG
jgi:hypothetical protein